MLAPFLPCSNLAILAAFCCALSDTHSQSQHPYPQQAVASVVVRAVSAATIKTATKPADICFIKPLPTVSGGSAIGLSATDAWIRSMVGDGETIGQMFPGQQLFCPPQARRGAAFGAKRHY